jgi:hypothetical protein
MRIIAVQPSIEGRGVMGHAYSPPCTTARRGGGVSKKYRVATEADADGVVFLSSLSENHPGLAGCGGFAAFS